MPLNVSIFPPAGLNAMAHNAINATGPVGAHSVLAASTSQAIDGPCQLVLVPDEGERVSLIKQAGDPAADPAGTAMKLVAGVARSFELGPGKFWLRWIAG